MQVGEEKTALSCRSSGGWDPGLHFLEEVGVFPGGGEGCILKEEQMGLFLGHDYYENGMEECWEAAGGLRGYDGSSPLLDGLPALQWQESSNSWFSDPFQVGLLYSI